MRRSFCFNAIILLLALSFGSPANAQQSFTSGQQRNQLIELFTSEGCSSCPPADAWLSEFTQHPLLWNHYIPVAYHVDYWDYLGWNDRLASKKHSNRQQRYKTEGGIAAVYTPGFVVNGEEWRGFFSGFSAPKKSVEPAGNLSLTVTGDRFNAHYANHTESTDGPPTLTIGLLGMDLSTNVRAGENRNRTLSHNFVLLDKIELFSKTAQWQGKLNFQPTATAEKYALIAWVSQANSQAPIQALGGWFTPTNLK